MRGAYLIFGFTASVLCGLGAVELSWYLQSTHTEFGLVPGAIFFLSSWSVWLRAIEGLDNDRTRELHDLARARTGFSEPDWNALDCEEMRKRLRTQWCRADDAEMRESWQRKERMADRGVAVAAVCVFLSLYVLILLNSIDWTTFTGLIHTALRD